MVIRQHLSLIIFFTNNLLEYESFFYIFFLDKPRTILCKHIDFDYN